MISPTRAGRWRCVGAPRPCLFFFASSLISLSLISLRPSHKVFLSVRDDLCCLWVADTVDDAADEDAEDNEEKPGLTGDGSCKVSIVSFGHGHRSTCRDDVPQEHLALALSSFLLFPSSLEPQAPQVFI